MTTPNTFIEPIPTPEALPMRIFEPALLQFSSAYRVGEPVFADLAFQMEWRLLRAQLWRIVLRIISTSIFKDELICRGSYVLKQWYPKLAREPGDLDWVVRDPSHDINGQWSNDLFEFLQELPRNILFAQAGVVLGRAAIDDIWTYDRVPGKRIVFYWQTARLGYIPIQMDFVFREVLWKEPVLLQMNADSPLQAEVWVTDKELALAHKLLWISTDLHPQGKDLYDAVLLAENTPISVDLLTHAIVDSERLQRNQVLVNLDFDRTYINWDWFQREYPHISGTESDWLNRLKAALKPSLNNLYSHYREKFLKL